MHRSSRAALVAAILTLALALPVAAESRDEASVSETLTVEATISLSVPFTSIAYGTGFGGDTLTHTAPLNSLNTINASTNGVRGLTIAVAATNLVSSDGSIAASQRAFWADAAAGCVLKTGSTSPTAPNYTTAGTDKALCVSAAAGDASIAKFVSKVFLPSSAAPGAYTGTLTFSATVNP